MSNPLVLLLVWIGSTILAAVLTGWACYVAGYDRCERDQDRHRHRHGDPVVTADLPRSGRLTPVPEPGWSFFGGAQLEVPPGPAEYELLTQGWVHTGNSTPMVSEDCLHFRPEPCESPGCTIDETPSDFTRRMALDMDSFIAKMEGDTNYLLHVMQARS
jgi:hypothetical protein